MENQYEGAPVQRPAPDQSQDYTDAATKAQIDVSPKAVSSGRRTRYRPSGPINRQHETNVRNSAASKSLSGTESMASNIEGSGTNGFQPRSTANDNIGTVLNSNLAVIKERMNLPENQDIIIREIRIGRRLPAFLVYIDGMVDKSTLNLAVYPQLMAKDSLEGVSGQQVVRFLVENVLTVVNVSQSSTYRETIMQVLNGSSALFVEGCAEAILIETRGYEKRNVSQPVTETVVRGPQEGYTENLRTNITLLRRIIKNEKLTTEFLPLGKTDHSSCAVIYLNGIVNPNLLAEVKRRIKSLNADWVMGSGMLEQFIEDDPYMLFPQILSTERPDRTASYLMEGHVAIIADGTPFALIVPVTFDRLLFTSEESFLRWQYGTFLRLIRFVGFFVAILLPGLYVSLVLFHPEMIPTELLTSIAVAKERVPFPTVVELILLEISFELIREAGIRVPGVIGQTLGIIGALILGQAAVSAGLVSPILIIVVAITGLGNFAIPNYTMALALRILRFFFILLGAVFGFYGISAGVVLFSAFACSMKSFGVPFFSPLAPYTRENPDYLLRLPAWSQSKRPDVINSLNNRKLGKQPRGWVGGAHLGTDEEHEK